MERKIGEIFERNGEWYQCIVGNNCGNCSFNEMKYYSVADNGDSIGECCADRRKDNKDVIFKKLEKVGEPFTIVGKLYQHYKVFDIDNVYGDVFWCVHNYKAKILTIEIKQNKEDMEEKELTYEELLHYYHSTVGLWAIDRNPQEVHFDWICKNAFQLGMDKNRSNSENIGKKLKPFDLDEAKAGKPVCTRDGRKARIICFDGKGDQPIIALVEAKGNKDALIEKVERYFINGHSVFEVRETNNDLMMLPEKKEGWVNVYYDNDASSHRGCRFIYDTKERAVKEAGSSYITTVKINWEE